MRVPATRLQGIKKKLAEEFCEENSTQFEIDVLTSISKYE
jgi:hypothetical protein